MSFVKPAYIIGAVALAVASPAAAQSPTPVEEVFVTAERRLEPIQTVPMAITAFSGRQLTELQVDSLTELTRLVPGVQTFQKKGAGLPTFVIRGVALTDANANNSPAAAVYVDDIYQSSTAMAGMALFDLDRIEVLKGPQGGLFGRDTSGGALQVVSQRPNFDRADGYLTAGYGRWNSLDLEGATTLKLTDALAVRISGLRQSGQGGWQYSLTDQRHWGAADRTAGRIQIRFAPMDRLDINLKLQSSWDGSQTPLARSVALYTRTGDFCAAALSGRRDDAGCFTLNQAIRTLSRRPLTPQASVQTPDGSTTLSRAFNELHNREQTATLSAVWRGDGFDVTSITGLGRMRYGQNYDFAASPDRLALQTDRAVIDTASQEFRIASTGDGPVRWLAGAVYAKDDFADDRSIDIRENLLILQALGIPNPARGFLQLAYNQDSRYAAAYGQVDWTFADGLTATGSVRYSDQKKRYYNGLVAASRPYIVQLSGLASTYKLDDHWSGKLGLNWRPSTDALVYASASKGYKSGGVFGGFNTIAGQITPYDEEVVWAYEAGFKTQWLDRRIQLNGSVFHYDYKDTQGFTNVLFPVGGLPAAFPLLTNLGDARHNGVELETAIRPAKGLTLQGGVSWLDAKYVNTSVVNTSPELLRIPLEGRRRAFAPRWSGFALVRYEAELTPDFRAAAQVDANFRSDQTFPVTPVERALGAIKGFGLVNGRLSLDALPYKVSLSVWTTNIFDKRYRTDIGTDGLGSYAEIFGEPRSYGLEITKRW